MLKLLIVSAVFILTAVAGVYLDSIAVNYFVTLLPTSVSEWIPLFKIICWFIVLSFTFGIIITISLITSSLTAHFIK